MENRSPQSAKMIRVYGEKARVKPLVDPGPLFKDWLKACYQFLCKSVDNNSKDPGPLTFGGQIEAYSVCNIRQRLHEAG